MKKSLTFWSFIGFIFTSVAGTILHFVYQWSNESLISVPFSAVNESTWEHMKLLFFPLFIFSFIEYRFIGSQYKNFWCAKLAGTVLGLASIPTLFYTYTGVFGKSIDFINISIFFVAVTVAFLFETWIMKRKDNFCTRPWVALIVLVLIAVIFVIFTFVPPQIPLFEDPITGLYGVGKQVQ